MALRIPLRNARNKFERISFLANTRNEQPRAKSLVPKSVVTSGLVLDSFPERARKRKCIGAFQIFQVDTVSPFPTECACVCAYVCRYDNARAPSYVEGSKLRAGAVEIQ